MATNTPTPKAESLGDVLLDANFTDPQRRKDPEYGKQLLSRIFRQQNNSTVSFYFGGRNLKWDEYWKWAMGKQNMAEFADFVTVDGNTALTPVDTTPNGIAPQFVETLINSMSQDQLYPSVTAIDEGSVSKKMDDKIEAIYRMKHAEEIGQMQQTGGMQLEPSGVYIPDDELSAEVYFKLEHRLPEEIEFSELAEKVMNDNQFSQKNRATLRDLIVLNCSATKIEKNPNGFVAIRKCNSANLVYNFFMADSGKMELSYIGEIYHLKVRDLRRRFAKSDSNPNGILTEKDIFELAKSSTQLNNANRFNWYWNQNYNYSVDRPYDDFGISVFDCEIKVFDCDYYVAKKDNYGKEIIQTKSNIPKPTSEDSKVIQKDKFTVYRGIWCTTADKMVYWGYPDVTIKPFMDISESLFSYTIQIPNNDGDFVPSLFGRALSPLRKWTLADLKLKQLMANLRPAGLSIDIERLRDVDIGAGLMLPMQIIKMYNQKGDLVWSSRGLDPSQINERPPVTELPNAGSVAQLTELTNIMNQAIQEIRSVLGVPVYRDGSDVGDRTAARLAEGQQQSSFNVTDYISKSNKSLWEETLHKCTILAWDDVVLRQNRTDLMDTVFETRLDLIATEYERQMLEQNIQIAMKTVDSTGKPLLSFKDAFKIRNIQNFKMAEMYLANMTAENERKHIAESERLQSQNAQVQQQSAAQAAQGQQQLQDAKIEAEKQLEVFKSQIKEKEILLQGVLGVYDTALKAGVPLPPEVQQMATMVFQNVKIPLMQENQAQVDAAIQQKHEQMAHQFASNPNTQIPTGGQQMQEPPAQEQAEPQQEPQAQENTEIPQQ
jgi:hypothetical protein